jgi:hypothetical protein
MRRIAIAATTCLVVSLPGAVGAAELTWEVENPFRFFKPSSSFALHENAFRSLRGTGQGPIPADIVWRMERRLNDPDCKNRSTPDACAATKGPRYEQSRLGWASQTLSAICYDNNARPRRYVTQCERRYSWGSAKEDYILPEAHTVNVAIDPQTLGQGSAQASGSCVWSWQPRNGGKAESRTLPCKDKLTIARVPFALDKAVSGVSVSVKLPDGRTLTDPYVVIEDILLVALGDSFASGESNPDRPVTFSAVREMVYDPTMQREEQQASRKQKVKPNFELAAAGEKLDPKTLPKRKMSDEDRGELLRPASREFLSAFEQRAAQWVSLDCHRSQYGYPFRTGIQLALENRHRAVTFVTLACSGAEVAEGLFLDMQSREDVKSPGSVKARAQLDVLSDLICRNGAAGRTVSANYTLPVFQRGSTQIQTQSVTKQWCAPGSRKRPVDLVLLSLGGNDVGFSALAAYALTESAGDLAPIVQWIGSQIRFGPNVSRAYLNVLDERFKALKDALRDGFGVDPARVVHTSYEPIQFDETGQVCGAQPDLGMDVHPKIRLSQARLTETADFLKEFLARLECISNARRRSDCPAGLATGAGTGFNLVTEHQQKFARRGICARDPQRAAADGAQMVMPRKSRITDEFTPFSPAAMLPYASRWRLFRTPNDAFLIANTHREGISPFDILQPAYAALYSGAIHPSAEAHAIVADSVMPYARAVLDKRPAMGVHIEVRPVTGAR